MTSTIASELLAGWDVYPSNLPADETLGFDVDEYNSRLTERSRSLFSDDVEVRIFDVDGS